MQGVYCISTLYTIIHYVLYCTGRTWYMLLYHCIHNVIIKIKNITYIKHYYVYNKINYYLLHSIIYFVYITYYYIICLLHFIFCMQYYLYHYCITYT